MSSINLTQAKPFTLLEPIGTTEAEISVKNLVDIYGEQVVMSGDIQYATLEPKSLENQEIISYTDIVIISSTVSKLTGVTRGCDAQPDPVTGLYGNSPTQAKPHAGDVTCILSDNPQVWDKKTSKDEDETVTGNWTFTEQVIVPNPNLGQEAVNLDTLNSVVVSGAGDASTIAKGITRLSESPNLTIGTATITIATPAVVTYVSHGLTVNDTIQFTTTGTLPTGILPSTTYYVISTGLTADAFQISATYSGTAIDTTGSQSGTHTLIKTTPVAVGVYDTRLPTQDENDALGGTAGTPSSSNPYVTDDDTTGTGSVVRESVLSGADAQVFGSGVDGNVTISSNTSLTRDMYYNNLTIQTGFTLSPKGFRIFVAGTLNCEGTGKIASNGGNGGTGAVGNTVLPTGGTAGAVDYSTGSLPIPKAGVVGANGTNGDLSNGTAGLSVTLNLSEVAAGAGGVPGRGSFSATVGTGGAAGAGSTAPKEKPYVFSAAYKLYDLIASTLTRHDITPSGGSGGGGGGNGGGTYGGGGGGSGSTGGLIFISAKTITNLNVEAIGGNGGTGGAGILNSGGGGGGAGGNGGIVIILYRTKTTVTSTVTGGTAGTGGAIGTGTSAAGSNGATGNSGVTYQLAI